MSFSECDRVNLFMSQFSRNITFIACTLCSWPKLVSETRQIVRYYERMLLAISCQARHFVVWTILDMATWTQNQFKWLCFSLRASSFFILRRFFFFFTYQVFVWKKKMSTHRCRYPSINDFKRRMVWFFFLFVFWALCELHHSLWLWMRFNSHWHRSYRLHKLFLFTWILSCFSHTSNASVVLLLHMRKVAIDRSKDVIVATTFLSKFIFINSRLRKEHEKYRFPWFFDAT